MSFIRNVSVTFATKVILFLLGLVTSIVMARIMGPEGKGLFTLAVLSAAVVYRSANLGIGSGSGYFLGRRKVPLDELAGNWLSLSILIGASVMAVSISLAPTVAHRVLPSLSLHLVVIAMLTIPFSVLHNNFQLLFKASSDFKRFNIMELAQPATFLILFVILAVVFSDRMVDSAVVAYLVSCAFAGLLALLLARQIASFGLRWSGELARSAVRFGVQGYLASLLHFLNLRFDLLLVNLFLAPAFVGYYSISVMIAEKIWYVPDVLSVVLHPRVAHGSDMDANRDTTMISRQTLLIITFCCLIILLTGRFAIRLLFSERFLPAVTPLFVLLPGVISASLSRIITSDLLARGHPRVALWAGLASLVTNIGLNLVLIPMFGVNGAALATTVSYSMNAIVVVSAFVRIAGVSVGSVLVPRREDISVIADRLRSALRSRKDTDA